MGADNTAKANLGASDEASYVVGGTDNTGCRVQAGPGVAEIQRVPRRIVFTMGGKGGVGKSTVAAVLAEWYEEQGLTMDLLDLDWENKREGCLSGWFKAATKIDIRDDFAYDKLLAFSLDGDKDIVLADMGAAQGYRAHDWFKNAYQVMQNAGIPLRWTAIGVVTPDPASVRSVLDWAEQLQATVDYLIVHNFVRTDRPDSSSWSGNEVERFENLLHPEQIKMDYRRPDLEIALRKHRILLGTAANRKTGMAELDAADMAFRARTYRARLFSEFDRVRRVLLP